MRVPSRSILFATLAALVLPHVATAQSECASTEAPAWIASVNGANALPGTLPPCASALMRSVHDAVMRVANGGTIAPELIASSRNTAETNALEQGPRIFGRMADLIAGAEHEVLVQNWRWDTNAAGHRSLMDGLRRLAANRRRNAPHAAPVDVRILVNVRAFEDPAMLANLAGAVERLGLDPRHVRVRIAGHTHTGLGALHTKVTIVDGRSAVTTGANVQANHDTLAHNYDLGFTMHGDVARSMRAEFADAWSISEQWTCGASGWRFYDVLGTGLGPCWSRSEPLTRLPMALRVPRATEAGACTPMLVVTRPAAQSPWANDDANPQNQAFLAAIDGARSRIRIFTPNINDEAVKDALARAIARGVTIELMTGKGYQDFAENLPTRGGSNSRAFASILEKARALGAANPCRQFRARWYVRTPGRGPVVGNVDESIHAKYLSVDNQLSIVGSANLDEQSFDNSREVNVVIDDAAMTAAWDRQVFEDNYARGVPIEACGAL